MGRFPRAFPLHPRIILLAILLLALSLVPAYGKPYITSFSMDMHYGLITVQFSEEMMSKFFDATKITLQNTQSYYNCTGSQSRDNGDCDVSTGALRIPISSNAYSSVYNATSLYVSIGSSDYATLSMASTIATSADNIYIVVDENVTRSSGDLSVSRGVFDGSALMASELTADALKPAFSSYTLDMDTGYMNLTFGEPVNASSFLASGITFQATDNLGTNADANTITLTNMNVTVMSGDGLRIKVDLGLKNLNDIKALSPLGIATATTYLSISSPAIKDIAGNEMSLAYLSIYEGKQPTSFTPDTTTPTLEWYDLDMDSGTLSLHFSETINSYQLDVTDLFLQENVLRASGTSFQLTSASTKATTTPVPVLTIALAPADMHAIKLMDMAVGSEDSKTYITFNSSLTKDMSELELKIEPLVNGVSSMNVVGFTADTTSPTLTSYVLDMNARTLELTFDEPVRANTLLVTYLTLQDTYDVATNDGKAVALSSGSGTSSSNGLVIVVDLCEKDFNALKLQPTMAISKATTFLTYSNFANDNFVKDMIVPTNIVTQVTDGNGVGPSSFVADQSKPSLRYYSMDMDSGELIMTFSEPVDASSLNVSMITLQSQEKEVICNQYGQCSVPGKSASNAYRLKTSSSSVVDVDNTTITVNVGVDDRNEVKVVENFYTVLGNTFLACDDGMASDISDYLDGSLAQNGVNAIPVSAALAGSAFTLDTTSPTLSVFTLDMDSGTLSITFDEPVRASTFNATGAVLWSKYHMSANSSSVELSKDSFTASDNGLTLDVSIAYDDLNDIKLFTSAFNDVSNTFLYTESRMVDDMADSGNAITNGQTDAHKAFLVTGDSTFPNLLSFDFDPVNGNLTLFFDEVVDASSFDAAGLTIQDAAFASTKLQLSDGAAIQVDGTSISAYLGSVDRTAQSSAGANLGTSAENTYITIINAAIADVAISPNQVSAITDGSGLKLGPALFKFSLDMDECVLTFRFSEPVNPERIDPTLITVQNSATASTSYTLTGHSGFFWKHNNYTVSMFLNPIDINAIKSTSGLLYGLSTSYVRMAAGAIYDYATGSWIGPNKLLEVGDGSALQAEAMKNDVTRPNLRSFTLDMDVGTLTLNFDEPVLASSFDATKLTLSGEMDSTSATSDTVTLSSLSTTASSDGISLVVALERNGGMYQDFDSLAFARLLATTKNDVFLVVTEDLVIDTSPKFNKVVAIPPTNGTKCSFFTPDETSPTLLSYSLDMNAETMTLTFSEAVWVDSTFDVTAIQLQDKVDDTFTEFYVLTTATKISNETDTIAANRKIPALAMVKLQLGQADVDQIKSKRTLANNLASTYISVAETLTNDIAQANNTFIAIDAASAKIATSHTADTTSPNLVSYTLDMNAGSMAFVFDEIVDPSSLDPSQIKIQYGAFAGESANQYALASSAISTDSTVGSRTFGVTLSADDLNNLKLKLELATGTSDTYLQVPTAFISDMAGNAITIIRDGRAQQVSSFTPDTTRPSITSFQLRTNGKIILKFSEAVSTTSLNNTGITLQNVDSSLAYVLTSATQLTGDALLSTKLTLSLGQDFIDAQLIGVATSQLTSYMSASMFVITDIAGNRVDKIAKNDAVLMGPALESFNLDMDKRKIDFFFSESVKGNFSADALTLFDERSGSNSITLTDWNFTADPTPARFEKPYFQANSTDSVTAYLSAADVTAIKSNGYIGTGKGNTYLSISSVTPFTYNEDTQSVGSPLQIVPIITSKAMQVSTFLTDAVKPTLTGYDLDKDSGVLTLRFDEPVELKTFNQSGLVIQRGTERGTGVKFVNLGADSVVTRTNHLGYVGSDTVTVTLGTSDLGRVLSLDLGAYMTMTAATAWDMADENNPVVAIPDGSAIAASSIVPDSTGPQVVSFGLDLEIGVLSIVFSEPIDGDTFDSSKFSIQGSPKKNVTGVYNLTTASVITSNVGDTIEVDMNIFRTDLDGIKAMMLFGVAKHRNQTYMAVKDAAFTDYNSNPGQGILHEDAIIAGSYVYDRVEPTLRSYDLEINTANNADPEYGKLTLHFSEPVDPTSIVLTNLKLIDTDSAPYGQELTLGLSSVSVSSASSSVEVTLSAGELSALQAGVIGTGGVSFLSIAEGSAKDMSGNFLAAIDHQMIGPVLEYTTLSLRDGAETISMIFSEDVKTSSFDPTGLTFVSANDGTGESYQLTSNSTLTVETAGVASTKVLGVRLGAKDIENLKTFAGLAVSKETAKVQLAGSFITDMAATANPVVAIAVEDAPNVNSFTSDATEPSIVKTSLDLSTDVLVFEFDEPILASAVKMNQITFQSKSSLSASGLDKYTLVDSVYGGGNNATISLTLGFNDMSAIKSISNLCSYDKGEDCYFSFLADTFQDTALSPNSVPLVGSSAGVSIGVVYNDTKAPSLDTFNLDLDADTLTLNFDEPVLSASFIPWKLSMQRAMTNVGTHIVVLPSSTSTASSDGSSIVLDLPVAMIETLMLDVSLATDRVTSFLMMELGAFTDARGNNVTSISNGYAKPATLFVFDTTPPVLVKFDLDMNAGKATVEFQEYVRVQEVTMKGITVQNSTSDNPVEHVLALGTALEQTVNNSKVIVLVFTEAELNTIKDYDSLCHDKNSSYLKMAGSSVLDMGSNGNTNMENSDAFMATSFTPDSTPPKLSEYDLDLDSGLMTLKFDETVDEFSFDQTGIKLHDMAAKKYSSVHDLVSPTVNKGTMSASNVLYMTLSAADLASIKDKGIGKERNSTWLSMAKGTVKDKASLDVEAVLESGIIGGASMRVTTLNLDQTEPGLVKFRIDRVGKKLYAWFTEPVTVKVLDSFRFSNSSGGVLNFLNTTFEYKKDSTQVIWDFDTKWNTTNMGTNVTVEESFWQKMVYLGVEGSGAMKLTIAGEAVQDLSPEGNFNEDILLRAENFPTCGCGGSQFVKTPCNSIDDAVCQVCTNCGNVGNSYQSAACQPTVDTACSACTPCNHGFYPSVECGGVSDNVCSVCTTCTDMEYETSACESGINRICASCKVCVWLNSKQEMFCNSRSKAWQKENCCFDKEGNQIKCGKVDFVNLEIEARNGRHHWVFPDTTPHIEGYKLGEWP